MNKSKNHKIKLENNIYLFLESFIWFETDMRKTTEKIELIRNSMFWETIHYTFLRISVIRKKVAYGPKGPTFATLATLLRALCWDESFSFCLWVSKAHTFSKLTRLYYIFFEVHTIIEWFKNRGTRYNTREAPIAVGAKKYVTQSTNYAKMSNNI